jgi:hypothetical protein
MRGGEVVRDGVNARGVPLLALARRRQQAEGSVKLAEQARSERNI